jgi:membrane-associated phospholipid phosphatase
VIFTTAFIALFLVLWLLFTAAGPWLERLLSRTAHWTTAFRYGDYLPVFVVLLLGITAAGLAGNVFLDLIEHAIADSPELGGTDARAHAWARSLHTAGATSFFLAMTIIGTPVGLGMLVLIVTAVLVAKHRWRWASYLVFTTGVGGLLNKALKLLFARERPELAEALRNASGYSFPSGHAMGATVVFGALCYLAFRGLPKWRPRGAALAFGTAMVVAISFSRVYLGVHWMSDIAAGVAAGVIWLATTTVAYETSRRIRLVRSLRAVRQKSGQMTLRL